LIAFLFSCRVGYVSGCISLRLVGGFLREVVVLRATQTAAEPLSANAYKIYVSVSDMKHAQPQAPSSGNVVRDVLNSGNVSELASVQEA